MHGFPDQDEPIYGELMEEALLLLAVGDLSDAFSQAWQACLINQLYSVSAGLMDDAAMRADFGLASNAKAVMAKGKDEICVLVSGQRLSPPATLLPASEPTADIHSRQWFI
jgi:hypothetical protein